MRRLFLLYLAVAAIVSCSGEPHPFQVIPMPQEAVFFGGAFNVKGAAVKIDPALDSLSQKAAGRFIAAVQTSSGEKMRTGEGGISFELNTALAQEQYIIDVTRKGVTVQASSLNGIVYACETLKQMLPSSVYSVGSAPVGKDSSWRLSCCHISDEPRFAYRGLLLDASRYYWSIEETKRILDVMAACKLNRFHWHLTDDQGWRVEIKAYPGLTEKGAYREGTQIGKDRQSNDGIRHGGFYTQDEMRDIVRYAAERGITVIPEIDLPGHMMAALAAYPQLGCTGGPYEVWTHWGVSTDILCAGNEEVYVFLEKVLSEVMDVFPSEYIHIGGDECFGGRRFKGEVPWDKCPRCAARMKALGIRKGPDAKHYLQNYVTARIQGFLNEQGRRIIGWDEILQGDLIPGATIMSWRGEEGGIKAAEKGFDAIMTPSKYLYFDYYQSEDQDSEPLAWCGYLPIEKVYGYDPLEGIDSLAARHIIGVQANLWTEYISTPEHLEYMLLPRLCAASEVQWCGRGCKDYERFSSSLPHFLRILDVMGINYRKP